MTLDMKNLVDGSWRDGDDEAVDINPSNTDDTVGSYTLASRALTEDAVVAARRAFPKWSRSGIQLRHDILKKASDEILERRQELGTLLAREEGKTLAEAIGEVVRAGQVFSFFAGETLRIPGEHLDSTRPGLFVDVTREPVGVVAVITPWNFPIAIPAWKCAAALAYGNCVVCKPAELTPGCAWALADILHRAGVPDGVFNLVMGHGATIGDALVRHEGVDAVSFTGSVETGRHVAEACAARQARVQLEMGGKNPLLVLDDADLDTAVECAVNGAFYSTGQRCTASSRFIVTEGIHDRFVDVVVKRLNTLVVGDALDEATQVGPVVDQSQLDKNLGYLEHGVGEGARLSFGGEVLKAAKPGYYMRPALFTEVSNTMRIAREEIFGPVAGVIRVRDYDEALAVANDTEFGLSAGICTTSLKYANDFKRNAEAGVVMVNLPTAGLDYHVPFGGRKKSSYGPREQGRYALEFYTITETAYVKAG
jgi:aldehyde dehydrogenase (NAD+)